MSKLLRCKHGVVIACDINDIEKLQKLVRETFDVTGISAYKVGALLAMRYGLPLVVKTIREYTELPIIYDHQKAMTDIPDLGKAFAETVKSCGIDALIGFPQAGPLTEKVWIENCKEVGLNVIIGGEMTHKSYKKSEGGYISDDSLDDMYLIGANLGVTTFVVPATRIERVIHYKSILKPIVGPSLTLMAPGFISQGGNIAEVTKMLTDIEWHAIVGRAIFEASDIKQAAVEVTRELSSEESLVAK